MKKQLMFILLLGLMMPLLGNIVGALGNDGRCVFTYKGNRLATVSAGYFLPGWVVREYAPTIGKPIVNNSFTTYGGLPGDKTRVKLEMTYALEGKNSIRFRYAFTPEADLNAQVLFASIGLPVADYLNESFSVDGKVLGTIPSGMGDSIHLFSGKAREFKLNSALGPIKVSYGKPQSMLLQDNRRWSNTLSVRVGAHRETPKIWKGGVAYRVEFLLTLPRELDLKLSQPITLTAGKDWIPLEVPSLEILPGSALDFTDVVKLDPPAGKYGYVKAVGPHFEYEGKPGVPVRFYGVNFCFGAHNITPEQSEILATRLSRLGYNAVRYHHYERNICKRRIPGDSTQLDPVRMAQFDAMFAAMKAHGLYATTDMFVSREVYESEVYADGSTKKRVPMRTFKELCAFSPRARENWKAFARNFLNHVNPHTGLSYAKDPSLGLISLINEGTLGTDYVQQNAKDSRYKAAVLEAWNGWLNRKYGNAVARNKAWGTKLEKTLTELYPQGNQRAIRDFDSFVRDSEILMIKELGGYLKRDLGCRALVTNMNNQGKNIIGEIARSEMDYVDDHFYVDHPSFVLRPWSLPSRCSNSSVVRTGRPGGSACMFSRLVDKPFTITEWNYSGPGRYRGVGGILTGCMASIQDWAGLWRFAYSHGAGMFSASPAGYFDLKSDPLNQAADRASILLYLREDLGTAAHSLVASIDRQHQEDLRNSSNRQTVPDWNRLGMLCKLGTYVGKADSKLPQAEVSVSYSADAPKAPVAFTDYKNAMSADMTNNLFDMMRKKGWIPKGNRTDLNKNIFETFNGQFVMDSRADTMILNTPRTAGCFAPAGTTVRTEGMDVTVLDTDATVWVSSLSNLPIAQSKRLLLTHLTDLQNTNQRYNEQERRMVLSWGRLPYLVRNGRAQVVVKLANPAAATVWAIDTCGKRLRQVPAQVTPEGLKINLSVAGGANAQLMYEIEVK